ncbi:hypothetical protein JTE90_028868 [Oedothorax gibbosus]|uniref:PA domain-containing protein n=1 Tax=Oedothorax gibbosus TaxID=931172 RepID=A0AAV6U9Z5_9ARAC|nr:hypothetical protein JTE90_028868 [Oedothorax gibbosus]
MIPFKPIKVSKINEKYSEDKQNHLAMQYSYSKILIGCLVLVAVDATIVVRSTFFIMDRTVEIIANQDATIIDATMKGQLEFAAPTDACGPIANPSFVKTNESKNFVLINGTDNCGFMTKVKNARGAGFDVAILFDPFPEPFNYSNMTFPIEVSKINITVALVSCEDSIKLQKYIFPESREENVYVEIHPTTAYQKYIISVLICVVGIPLALELLYLSYKLVVWGVKKNRYRKHRNQVETTENVADLDETEPLLASESSAPNLVCQGSSEELKNELLDALGSVNDVQGSEHKRGNTQAEIV